MDMIKNIFKSSSKIKSVTGLTNSDRALKRNELFFENKHDAMAFIENYKTLNYIKNCGHVTVNEHSSPTGVKKFEPACEQFSFRYYNNESFTGCPDDCINYQSIAHSRFLKFTKYSLTTIQRIFLRPIHAIKWLLEWFSQLAQPTQTLIVISLICMLIKFMGLPVEKTVSGLTQFYLQLKS